MSETKEVNYASWSDEELAAKTDELAALRTTIRLEQNAVAAEVDLRRALELMSGAGRQALILRLTGGVGVDGDSKQEKK